jgi:hypothetical protein
MSNTANRNLAKLSTNAAEYEAAGPWATVLHPLIDEVDAQGGAVKYTAAGPTAVTIKEGNVTIGGSGVTALTLAVPTAGTIASGGDDGRLLRFMAVTAHAHTVTTPANGIDGAHHIATFAAAGDKLELLADNGIWVPVYKTPTNVVIS